MAGGAWVNNEKPKTPSPFTNSRGPTAKNQMKGYMMTTVQPLGEDLRKAVQWISDSLKYEADKSAKTLIEEACLKFNLSPKDAEYLTEFYRKK